MHQDSTASENTGNIRFRETLPPAEAGWIDQRGSAKNDLAHLLLYSTPLPRPRALFHNGLPRAPLLRCSLLEQFQLSLHLVDLVEQEAESFGLIRWGWGAGDAAERR